MTIQETTYERLAKAYAAKMNEYGRLFKEAREYDNISNPDKDWDSVLAKVLKEMEVCSKEFYDFAKTMKK